MRAATVPLSAIAAAGGRLDAGFYCDPGGEARKRAAERRARAERLLAQAEQDAADADAEVEAAVAAGVKLGGRR